MLCSPTSQFPNAAEQHELCAAVEGHTPRKLKTWFTNARRRSGWAEFHRELAKGSRKGMEELIKTIADGTATPEVIERYRSVQNWFESDHRDSVDPVIVAILASDVPVRKDEAPNHSISVRKTRASTAATRKARAVETPAQPSTALERIQQWRSVSDSSSASLDSFLSEYSASTESSTDSGALSPLSPFAAPLQQAAPALFNFDSLFGFNNNIAQEQQQPNPYFSTLLEHEYAQYVVPLGGAPTAPRPEQRSPFSSLFAC